MIDYKKLNLEQYSYDELNELHHIIGKMKSKLYRKEYEKNRKRNAEYQRKWRKDNWEHYKEVQQAYYQKNKEKIREHRTEYMREYRARKREEVKDDE